ncbi:hypothetical protein PCANC_11356 [Puccinia coronata f. sp. avenae]|uniref:Uncharacterized protein n=1 Tax=Puccinia coronata f. sp. avenae TaxID=200324 RepID=A0A2N5RYR6_9BASI|nr:hypothetical protein PCANC_25174 [Puccinia coronata f. sp. avenae]PLW53146.1 hypothetical protein PCANC_11356 [Puccinia coronata f. sp. avenae]
MRVLEGGPRASGGRPAIANHLHSGVTVMPLTPKGYLDLNTPGSRATPPSHQHIKHTYTQPEDSNPQYSIHHSDLASLFVWHLIHPTHHLHRIPITRQPQLLGSNLDPSVYASLWTPIPIPPEPGNPR